MNIQPVKHLECTHDDTCYKYIVGIVLACIHTSMCTDVFFYIYFCWLICTDYSCVGTWKIFSLGQNMLLARKVFFFFFFLKHIKYVRLFTTRIHCIITQKLAVSAPAMILILSHFQLIAGIARNRRVLVSVKS